MKKFKYFLVITLIFSLKIAQAQTSNYFDLFYYDLNQINPAFTGLENQQSFTSFLNMDDLGFKEANPREIFISYENQITAINSGISLSFLNLSRFGLREINAIFNYGSYIPLTDYSKLRLGIGFIYKSLHFAEFSSIPDRDPIIVINENIQPVLDMNFGISYTNKNLITGISIFNILNSNYKFPIIGNFTIPDLRYYNIFISNKFEVNKSLTITPSAYFQMNDGSQMINLNIATLIVEKFIIGCGYTIWDNDSYYTVNGGISINDKIQLLGVVYSSYFQESKYAKGFEFGLKVNLPNH